MRYYATVGADVRCYGNIEIKAGSLEEAEAKAMALTPQEIEKLLEEQGIPLDPDWSTLTGDEILENAVWEEPA